ncbi:fibroblast growth factor receptor 4-like isoform X1 [Anopheles albimanus]|nr:fibroblast growth factor receptor 4-like isoform X1 [Anopheles albimanus]
MAACCSPLVLKTHRPYNPTPKCSQLEKRFAPQNHNTGIGKTTSHGGRADRLLRWISAPRPRWLKDVWTAANIGADFFTSKAAMNRACGYRRQPPAPLFAVGLLLLLLSAGLTTYASPRPASDIEIPKVQQSVAGSEARLKCGIKEHHAEHMNASDVRWYFKPCGGGGFQQLPACSDRTALDGYDWRALNCDNKPCRVTLTIANVSDANAGLYRCTIHPYRTDNQTQLDIQLVRSFELLVIKSPLDESIPAPELMDNLPANTTAIVDTPIVLQCRVHSKVLPTIKWFRRLNKRLGEHSFNQNKSIRYLENFYELLPSAGEKLLAHDVYLSKLILYNASERDIGIYVCVGINYVGVSMADAYVNLVHANGMPVEQETTGGGYVRLMVLFLIPIALAMMPLLVWAALNVLRSRRSDEGKPSLGEPIATNVSAYDPNSVVRLKRERIIYGGSMQEHIYEKIDLN